MHQFTLAWRRAGLMLFAIGLAVVSVGAQAGRGGVPVADLIRQVRTALGHGDVSTARRVAETGQGDVATPALAVSLVDIFEGKYGDAGTRLMPAAAAAPLGEAALELGLLEVRTGHRAEGRRR